MSKFLNRLNKIKAGRAKVRAYGEGGTVDALESARDYLKKKYNNPEAGIPTKVATVLGLLPVNLARSAARAVTAPARSMTDENFNPGEEAANMAGFVTTGGIGLSKAGLGPKGDVLGMGVGKKLEPFGDPQREANLARHMEGSKAPPVLYHGTPNWEGTAYNPNQTPTNRVSNVAGFYADTNPETASGYAMDVNKIADMAAKLKRGENLDPSEMGYGPSSQVLPVHMAIKKPFVPGNSLITKPMLDTYAAELKATNSHLDDYSFENWAASKIKDFAEKKKVSVNALNGDGMAYQRVLKAGGYDGLKDGTAYVAFEPTQIKSAIGNRGTFDPTKPDITKASGGAVHQLALGAKLFGLK